MTMPNKRIKLARRGAGGLTGGRRARSSSAMRQAAMTRLSQSVLFWAPAPAIALSVWLLQIAEAPRSALTLQVVVAIVAMAVFVVLVRTRRVGRSVDIQSLW